MINFEEKKWLNETHVQKQLDHSNLTIITTKYPEHLRKKRQELVKCKDQPCRIFIREDFGIHVIMDCGTAQAVNFRKRLGFKQYDLIMTQEQSVLTKLDRYFHTEDKIFQHYVLGYRIDMHVPKYKLAIEVDELGHCIRDLKAEIKRQQKIEKESNCKFIRIDSSR